MNVKLGIPNGTRGVKVVRERLVGSPTKGKAREVSSRAKGNARGVELVPKGKAGGVELVPKGSARGVELVPNQVCFLCFTLEGALKRYWYRYCFSEPLGTIN